MVELNLLLKTASSALWKDDASLHHPAKVAIQLALQQE
jgi:hypothetical protein